MLLTYATPGTWYRAVFITSTIAFLAGAYMLGRFASRKVQWVALCLFLAILGPGMLRTRA